MKPSSEHLIYLQDLFSLSVIEMTWNLESKQMAFALMCLSRGLCEVTMQVSMGQFDRN